MPQANMLLGLPAGEVFVQRNVGNIVNHKDFNCMSCLEYGVKGLKVRHIMVCGHSGCGAVSTPPPHQPTPNPKHSHAQLHGLSGVRGEGPQSAAHHGVRALTGTSPLVDRFWREAVRQDKARTVFGSAESPQSA